MLGQKPGFWTTREASQTVNVTILNTISYQISLILIIRRFFTVLSLARRLLLNLALGLNF